MRCPSAKRVSKAKEDLPEPESPVMTTKAFLGMATLKCFRLLTWAFLIKIKSLGSRKSMSWVCRVLGNVIECNLAIKPVNCRKSYFFGTNLRGRNLN